MPTVCQGLKNKKDYVLDVIRENEIDICCLQETEIESSFPTGILSFKGYSLEMEMNDTKIRCGVYIKNCINSRRWDDLELGNTHFIVIDIDPKAKYRLISVFCLM